MKSTLAIILLFFTLHSFAQDPSSKVRKSTVSTERELPSKIIVNDSIYKIQNNGTYGFDVLEKQTVKTVAKKDITNINKIISVRNNILTFHINYDCGCGTIRYNLVSDGKVEKTEDGKEYYKVRLLFNSTTTCVALCHNTVNVDISELVNKKPLPLKFEGFNDFIEIR